MKYELVKSVKSDIEKIIEYKKNNIYEYVEKIEEKEKEEINNYAYHEVLKNIDTCYNIVVDNEFVGCVILSNNEDGKLLDEIYIEKKYRNKGIGTDIIKKIVNSNDSVYLWVYKLNTKAILLYKKIGFNTIEETETRLYMKYTKQR